MTQKEQIKNLTERLEQAKRHHYVYQSYNTWVQHGELHMMHGDYANGEEKHLVMNVAELYKDLPFIIDQIVKENKKEQREVLDNIKNTIKDL